jgi:hypothetical protein
MTMTDKRTAQTIEPEVTNDSPNNSGNRQEPANKRQRIRISVACGNCKKRKKRVSADKMKDTLHSNTTEMATIRSHLNRILPDIH